MQILDWSASMPERRGCPRSHVAIAAGFRECGRGGFEIDLLNMSRSGCRARLHGPIIFGEHVWVRLPSLAGLPAKVAWEAEGEAGIAFERPLHEAVAALLVSRSERTS